MKPAEFFEDKSEVEVEEKRSIKRVSFSSFVQNALQAFSLERGVVYTLKRLFKEPGLMTLDYLTGGRHKYVPPFRLLLVTTAIVILLLPYSNAASDFSSDFGRGINDEEIKEIAMMLLARYANIWLWIFIPIAAFFSWLFNRRGGFNYAENLVFHTYLFSITNVISIFFIFDIVLNSFVILAWASIVPIAYFMIAYSQFFGKSMLRALGEALLTYLISSIFYFFAIVGLLIVGITIAIKLKGS